MRFRNIIFDLGGVILNLDYNRTSAAFRQLGLASFDAVYSQARQSGLFDAYEKGQLSSAAFCSALSAELPAGTQVEQIEAAWNAMLLDLPAARMDRLRELGRDHRLFLLSNTNEIHIRAVTRILERDFGRNGFSGIFEREYYSYKIGMRKPDRVIFEHVLQENGLHPAETLFLDDSPQHVAGALQTGITARLVAGPDMLHPAYYI